MDKNLQTSAGSAGLAFVKPASCPLAALIMSSVCKTFNAYMANGVPKRKIRM